MPSYDKNIDKHDMQAVIDAARVGVVHEAGPNVFVVHNDMKLVDLESRNASPSRSKGTVSVHTPEALIATLDEMGAGPNGGAGIFIDRDPSAPAIVAILNYDQEGVAGWRDHRVVLEFRSTPAWKRWKAMDGKFMTQAEFAEFIEDNASEVFTPTGSELLELVSKLEVTNKAEFKSSVNLTTGEVEFAYADNQNAKVGNGKLVIPKHFMLGLAPFIGSSQYSVKANFRYRLREGVLTMGFKLMNVDKVVEDVTNDLMGKITAGTPVPIYEGTAPASRTRDA